MLSGAMSRRQFCVSSKLNEKLCLVTLHQQSLQKRQSRVAKRCRFSFCLKAPGTDCGGGKHLSGEKAGHFCGFQYRARPTYAQ